VTFRNFFIFLYSSWLTKTNCHFLSSHSVFAVSSKLEIYGHYKWNTQTLRMQ